MAKIKFGNADNQSFTGTPDVSGDQISFGDGTGDSVSSAFDGSISDNTIHFGIGAGDFVQSETGSISDNTIDFGIGAGDFVESNGISGNTIDFGGGANDALGTTNFVVDISQNTITFGDGFSNNVDLPNSNATGSVSHNTITFGNGDMDSVFSDGDVSFSNNTITLGDGNIDSVVISGNSGNNNHITVGNGSNDVIVLGSVGTTEGGGEYIATGTGGGDLVIVRTHTSPDTFAFALGTGVVTGTSPSLSANYTTVFGAQGAAQGGDQLVLNSSGNGNALGNTLVTETASASGTTFAQFIAGLEKAGLEKGHTYVGSTTSDPSLLGEEGPGPATFIVTDTQSGKIGAIELAGVHTVGIADHVLTLLS
jgi:hypothetical protein